MKQQFIPRPDQLCYDIEKKLMESGGSKVVKLLFIPVISSYAMILKTYEWDGEQQEGH